MFEIPLCAFVCAMQDLSTFVVAAMHELNFQFNGLPIACHYYYLLVALDCCSPTDADVYQPNDFSDADTFADLIYLVMIHV